MKHAVILSLALAAAPLVATAHGDSSKQTKKRAAQPMVETDFGRTGDPRKASRTIRVDMADTMRFAPAATHS